MLRNCRFLYRGRLQQPECRGTGLRCDSGLHGQRTLDRRGDRRCGAGDVPAALCGHRGRRRFYARFEEARAKYFENLRGYIDGWDAGVAEMIGKADRHFAGQTGPCGCAGAGRNGMTSSRLPGMNDPKANAAAIRPMPGSKRPCVAAREQAADCDALRLLRRRGHPVVSGDPDAVRRTSRVRVVSGRDRRAGAAHDSSGDGLFDLQVAALHRVRVPFSTSVSRTRSWQIFTTTIVGRPTTHCGSSTNPAIRRETMR